MSLEGLKKLLDDKPRRHQFDAVLPLSNPSGVLDEASAIEADIRSSLRDDFSRHLRPELKYSDLKPDVRAEIDRCIVDVLLVYLGSLDSQAEVEIIGPRGGKKFVSPAVACEKVIEHLEAVVEIVEALPASPQYRATLDRPANEILTEVFEPLFQKVGQFGHYPSRRGGVNANARAIAFRLAKIFATQLPSKAVEHKTEFVEYSGSEEEVPASDYTRFVEDIFQTLGISGWQRASKHAAEEFNAG